MSKCPGATGATKRCSSCKDLKAVELFGARRGDPHGRQCCKECNNRTSRECVRRKRYGAQLACASVLGALVTQRCRGVLYLIESPGWSFVKVGKSKHVEEKKLRARYSCVIQPGATVLTRPVTDRHAAERELLQALEPHKYAGSGIKQEQFVGCRDTFRTFLIVTQKYSPRVNHH